MPNDTQLVFTLPEALSEIRDLREQRAALLAGLAPIVSELHNGKLNGVWPATPGDARAVAAEIMRLVKQ